MMKYSVLMSVYANDNPLWLKEAIDYMLQQTILTNDFVIVKDGPLTTELEDIIKIYVDSHNFFKVIELKENVGLGLALKTGVNNCKNEYIARMDADDLSSPDRIEKQLKILNDNPNIDIIGSQVIEFIDNPDNVINHNSFPINHQEIVKYARQRNPFSHSAIVFKKSSVLKAGNYKYAFLCEDYDLWIRMILTGANCANSSEILHYVRINNDFYKRRGGLKYIKSINNLMSEYRKKNFFTTSDYIKNIIIRSIVYLMPNQLRSFVYSKFLRKG